MNLSIKIVTTTTKHKPELITSRKPPFNYALQTIQTNKVIKDVLSVIITIGHLPQGKSVSTWAGEMACAKVPLDELHVTEPFGPQGKERTLPALVSEYFTFVFFLHN